MKLLASVFCLLVAVATAHAQTTGNDILDRCQKAIHFYEDNGGLVQDQFDDGWCFGWVDSALSLSGLDAQWKSFNNERPGLLGVCAPREGVPVIQGVRILVKYLTDHPEHLHENGMPLTVAALKGAFPCKS